MFVATHRKRGLTAAFGSPRTSPRLDMGVQIPPPAEIEAPKAQVAVGLFFAVAVFVVNAVNRVKGASRDRSTRFSEARAALRPALVVSAWQASFHSLVSPEEAVAPGGRISSQRSDNTV